MAHLKIALGDRFHRENMDPIIDRYFTKLKIEERDDSTYCLDRLGLQNNFYSWFVNEKYVTAFWKSHIQKYVSDEIQDAFDEYLKKFIKGLIEDDKNSFYQGLELSSFNDIDFLLVHLKKHSKYTAYLEVFIKYYIARKEISENRLAGDVLSVINSRMNKAMIEITVLLRFYILVALYQMESNDRKLFDFSAFLQLEEKVLEKFVSNDLSEYKFNFTVNDYLRYVNSIKKFEIRFAKSFMEIWNIKYPLPYKFQIEFNALFVHLKTVIVLAIVSGVPVLFQKTARALVKRAFAEFDKKVRVFLEKENSGLLRHLESRDTKETRRSLLNCLKELEFLVGLGESKLEEDNDGQVPSTEGKIIKHIF